MTEEGRYKQYEPLFGSWYIKKRIGKGAVGQVYEIERKELDTTYRAALKAITIPEDAEDVKRVLSSGVAKEDLVDYYKKLIRNIANEFKYLARLKGNSYIVNYEDHQIIEDEKDMKWDILIKTELLTPLIEYVEEHPLTEDDVIRLGMDICRALKYCGQYNILHRDIKPENIFMSPVGSYKLGDFGIARMVEETYVNLSRKGTYTYMAPEVFHGEKYGQAADIYSLGLVMYKYLNHGRIPFMPPAPEKITYEDPENAFTERMSGKPLPEPAEGSAGLKKAVLKACAFRSEDRYRNAEEMLSDLEELYFTGSRKKQKAAKQAREKTVKTEKKAATRKSKVSKKTWLRLAAVILCAAGCLGAYLSIPKEIEDITGIDQNIQMYYDEELSPEYKIEPDWFSKEPITFTSEDKSVFTVSDNGVITAVAPGEADLRISAKDYSETAHIKVVPKVSGISGLEESYSLYTGGTLKLEPALQPKEFSGEQVSFQTTDESVAAVDADGTVTAVAPGEAAIEVSAGGFSTNTSIYVSAPPVSKTSTSSKSSGSSKKSSKTSTKKKSSGTAGGYFGDEEHF